MMFASCMFSTHAISLRTLCKALYDLVQLIRLAGAACGRLLTDDDVSVDVGVYEVPICGAPDCALDAHQTMLLQVSCRAVIITKKE